MAEIIYDPPEFVPYQRYDTGNLFKGPAYTQPEPGDIYEVLSDDISGIFRDVEPHCANRGGFAVGGIAKNE